MMTKLLYRLQAGKVVLSSFFINVPVFFSHLNGSGDGKDDPHVRHHVVAGLHPRGVQPRSVGRALEGVQQVHQGPPGLQGAEGGGGGGHRWVCARWALLLISSESGPQGEEGSGKKDQMILVAGAPDQLIDSKVLAENSPVKAKVVNLGTLWDRITCPLMKWVDGPRWCCRRRWRRRANRTSRQWMGVGCGGRPTTASSAGGEMASIYLSLCSGSPSSSFFSRRQSCHASPD